MSLHIHRKTGLLFLLLSILFGCTQEHLEVPTSSEGLTSIVASTGNDTKLAFEDQGTNGVKVKWSSLDAFTLYDASGNYAATFVLKAGEEGSARGEFVSGEALTSGSTYSVVYPAATNTTNSLEEYAHYMYGAKQESTGTDHLSDLCFMHTTYTHSANNSGFITFGYEYALMTVKMATPDSYSSTENGIPCRLIFNNGAESYTLSLENVDWSQPLTAYFMVKPCAVAERRVSAEIRTTTNSIYRASFTSTKAWEAGKRYTADFTTQKLIDVSWEVIGNTRAQNATNAGTSLANIIDGDPTTEWTASWEEGTVAPNGWPRIITIDMKETSSVTSFDITRKQNRTFSWGDNIRDIYNFTWILSDVIPTDVSTDATYWGNTTAFPNRSYSTDNPTQYGSVWFNTDVNPVGWQNFLVGKSGRYLSIIMEGSGNSDWTNSVQGSRFAEVHINIDDASVSNGYHPEDYHEKPRISNQYSVSVQQANGSWEPISVHSALVSDLSNRTFNDNDNTGAGRDTMSFAKFINAFSSPVKVRIKKNQGSFSSVQVRPLAYAISAQSVGDNTVELSLQNATEKISVEFDGDRMHNLFLFPDSPDTALPNLNGAKVIYYGPGEHTVGRINLTSGQTLYLAAGAIVYGDVRITNASNVTVRGRGILCSSKESHDWTTRSQQIQITSSSDVTIRDITLRDSPHWSILIDKCTNVVVDNVKQISWMKNSDGVDICNSSYVEIRNCFFRNYDDNVTCKNFGWAWRNTEHILVENNAFWADAAHCMLVGPEGGKADGSTYRTLSDIIFRGNTVLENKETYAKYTGAFAIMASNTGTFQDITFENIIIEDISGGRPFSIDYIDYDGYGDKVSNITLKNITYTGATTNPPSLIRGYSATQNIAGITLENVLFNGQKQTGASAYLTIGSYVDNLVFR